MPEQTSSIISKVWGMCNPLRDDGVSYGDYLEQLTYLIFLKMSDEYSKPPYKKETGIPAGYTWHSSRPAVVFPPDPMPAILHRTGSLPLPPGHKEMPTHHIR